MKREDNQEFIMLISMCLVVLVVMFGATVAWYNTNDAVSINDIELQADDLEDLQVYVKVMDQSAGELQVNSQGQLDDENIATGNEINFDSTDKELESMGYIKLSKVGTGDNVAHSIDMNIVELENIQPGTIAPGSFGQVKFKIKSTSDMIRGYRLTIMPNVKMLQNIQGNLTEDMLKEIMESHIKFYAKYEVEGEGSTNKVYKHPILYYNKCIFEEEAADDEETTTATDSETESTNLYNAPTYVNETMLLEENLVHSDGELGEEATDEYVESTEEIGEAEKTEKTEKEETEEPQEPQEKTSIEETSIEETETTTKEDAFYEIELTEENDDYEETETTTKEDAFYEIELTEENIDEEGTTNEFAEQINALDGADDHSYLQDSFTLQDTGYVYRNGLNGVISKGEIIDVTLYWYWPYEFVDIPECLKINEATSIFYDEFKRYTVGTLTDAEKIEKYDWDDTYIGNYISELFFHFDVETIRE